MKTHNDSYIDANGTCLQGYIQASYHTLVDTIYNWKNGPNYGGSLTRPEDINEWHVGGNSPDAVTAINNILDECRGVRLTAAY